MKPIVQISLDVVTIDEALSTAQMALRAGVDWLEAGTPLIIAEGMHGVRALRERFPNTPIVADLKTMDGGYTSNSAADRKYAIERSKRAIDIANAIGCGDLVLWLARE